jgi:hypothetical protein
VENAWTQVSGFWKRICLAGTREFGLRHVPPHEHAGRSNPRHPLLKSADHPPRHPLPESADRIRVIRFQNPLTTLRVIRSPNPLTASASSAPRIR